MSDFGDPSVPRPPAPPPPPPSPGVGPFAPQAPPPPPPGAHGAPPPPPPGAYGAAPPPPAPVYGAPGTPSPYGPQSAFGQQQYAAMRTTRPRVTTGAVLLIAGGVVAVIGSFVTWYSQSGTDFNGFSKSGADSNDGSVFVTFGLVLVAFGVALLSAKKVLAITIIGIVVAALLALFSLADIGNANDLKDKFNGVTVGAGLYICLVGALIALGGAIVATATRRR